MRRGMSRTRMAAVSLALVSIVAACSGNQVKQATAVPNSTTTTVPLQSDEHIETGGELNIGIEARPPTLDPFTVSVISTSSWQYANDALYDGLFGRSPLTGKVEGRLAVSAEPNADFTVWIVKLRTDVTFQDGTPFNAAVVVANLTYRGDPAKCKCSENFAPMTAVAADDATVTITLKEPDAHLPDPRLMVPMLAISTLQPGVDRDRHPIGTGPFELVDRDQLTLRKNPTYWRTDDRGRKLPHLDRLKLTPIDDGNVRLAALDKGESDMREAYDGGTISAAQADKNVTTFIGPGAGSTVAVLNSGKPPFDDPRARMAVAKATNREALTQSVPHGGVEPAYSFISPKSPYKITGRFPAFDLAAAKQLTSEIAKEKGKAALDITIVCVTFPDAQALMSVSVNQLKEVGFNPTLRLLDIGAYAQAMLSGDKDFNLACARAPGFGTDPSGLATVLRSNGVSNVASYHSAAMDKLFDQDMVTTDVTERTKIYQQVNDLVIKDLPYMPLLVNTAAVVTRPSVVRGVMTPSPAWTAEVDTAWLWRAKS